ncbi:MAG: NAD(P)/FAD-dependent oxidoreductase [Akkermansiaceae bacterium]|nr:NAD(P)/FAD-dependent oxidoreductase [Akkermansiaceae bacterium]
MTETDHATVWEIKSRDFLLGGELGIEMEGGADNGCAMVGTGRIIVVGGGAAGFFGAISAAEVGAEEVLILEKGPAVLGKVKISGGGRCNVTHACFDPKELVGNYPRGEKSLIGPLHRWRVEDTVAWFAERGVELKTEGDGRMFPVTDSSQTVIDCLTGAARKLGVEVRTRCGVKEVVKKEGGGFLVRTSEGEELEARCVLMAGGGVRSSDARRPVEELGHVVEPPVPSLFTFHIEDERLAGLPGVSVPEVRVSAAKISAEGPVLVTHTGLSGPAVLKLSAWGARKLAEGDYRFELAVDWTAGRGKGNVEEWIASQRQRHGARKVGGRSLVDGVPRRLWERLCGAAGIGPEQTWAALRKEQVQRLCDEITDGRYAVTGKSLNKEEFVTCGGVRLKDVNLKTMESRLVPGLYFAGEVLDVDGVTGGFNFQAAWTTGRIAGEAMGEG